MLAMTGVLFMTQLQLMSRNMPPEAMTGQFAQTQKMMLYLFPVMYLVGGVSIPIGVLVYWLTSNLWTLGQQYLLMHNNPTPNTPAYIDWEERMIRKGKDPKMIQAERIAKRQKRPATTPVPGRRRRPRTTRVTERRRTASRSCSVSRCSASRSRGSSPAPRRVRRARRPLGPRARPIPAPRPDARSTPATGGNDD
jgi:YidC/Oxa1 family membrane protein insertase